MAILNRDDFFSRIQAVIATAPGEDGTAFLEDMTDTYNSLEDRANGNGEDWEKKYHELDKAWEDRYRHRFFSGGASNGYRPDPPSASGEDDEYDPDAVTFNDLFK